MNITEPTFEQVMFEGLLNMTFLHLYQLPLNTSTFNCLLVNKRWRSIFQHPLETFYKGEFTKTLIQHPPSYYAVGEKGKEAIKKFSTNGAAGRQLRAVKENEDEERVDFIVKEMLVHSFNHHVSKSVRIQNVIDIVLPNKGQFAPDKMDRNMSSQLEIVSIITWAKVWLNIDLYYHLVSIWSGNTEFYSVAIQNLKSQGGSLLRFVPGQCRTEELCKTAVKYCGLALQHVPTYLITEDLCKVAVGNARALQFVPQQMRNEEIYKIAVAHSAYELELIPDSLKTEEICKLAVQRYGYALKFVPERQRTEEMCTIAVKSYANALQFVPSELKTEDLCKMAVANSGLALRYVPERLKTEEVCRIALSTTGMGVSYLPEHLKTEEMCKIAVKKSRASLQYVPEHLKTIEVCKIAAAEFKHITKRRKRN
eukprot:TRINITY_DN3098_c0_g1_i2.p1 TRINITY_DN3098_c0_g1~~TRINITY_DN3098_c0_g1_i2.p1  ORF type:complete len:424 (+),score=52.19 TRINITY_DN3098_c0_g1_i2:137-1408(+)